MHHHLQGVHLLYQSSVPVIMQSISTYVMLKDQKTFIERKKGPQRVVALEKQLPHEIACCGCF